MAKTNTLKNATHKIPKMGTCLICGLALLLAMSPVAFAADENLSANNAMGETNTTVTPDPVPDSSTSNPSEAPSTPSAPSTSESATPPADNAAADAAPRAGVLDNVPYIDAKGNRRICPQAEYFVESDPSNLAHFGINGKDSWYVTSPGTFNSHSSIMIHGNVHLILADGSESDVVSFGVHAPNSLTIYGQSTGADKGLFKIYGSWIAPIGTGDSTNIGSITINGGRIESRSNRGLAGIGGGTGNGGSITINGGEVTATGGDGAAGIGTGESGTGGTITINGGKVTATGGAGAAGLGGGVDAIIINGGTVISKSDGSSVALGSNGAHKPSLSVRGGTTIATGYTAGTQDAFGCAPISVGEGLLIAVPRADRYTMNGDGSVSVSQDALVVPRGFTAGIGISAGTNISSDQQINLAAGGKVTLANGTEVVAPASGGSLTADSARGIFIPANFAVNFPDGSSLVAPEHGLWLGQDGAPKLVNQVTVLEGGEHATGSGLFVEGDAVAVDAGTKADYVFDGWTASPDVVFADAMSPTTTFTMPGTEIVVTAHWKAAGQGGAESGGDANKPYDPDQGPLIKDYPALLATGDEKGIIVFFLALIAMGSGALMLISLQKQATQKRGKHAA